MFTHPYDQRLLPNSLPWTCSSCGNTCEAWRCDICRELHCGYDQSGPVAIVTLNEGTKSACRECADVNLDDVAVRDLKAARAILSEAHAGAFDDFEVDENPRATVGHAIEYIDRRTAEEAGVGYSEFCIDMLKDSLSALRKPVSTEAYDFAAIYAERFGEADHA